MAAEGNESFQIQIRTGSISGPIVATSSTITVVDTPSTYSVSQTATSVNEGGSVTFTITTTNVVNGTIIYWNTSGTASAADFSDGVSTGSVTINNNTGSITRSLSNDLTTEGSETFAIRFYEDAARTVLVASSSTVTIGDTSTTPTPTYTITPASTSVNEGQQMTWTISTTNFGSGTLYWTNSGTTTATDFTDNLNSGSISITNNAGTLTKTLKADLTTDPSETITIQLRTGSTSGTVVQTSSTVTVVDTSPAPPPTTSVPPPTTSVPPPTTSVPPPTTSVPPPTLPPPTTSVPPPTTSRPPPTLPPPTTSVPPPTTSVPPPVAPPVGTISWSGFSYNTSGTWTVPAGVTSISIAVCGAGAASNGPSNAGGAGGLAYIRNLAVTPGETFTFGVGGNGNQSSLQRNSTGHYIAGNGGYLMNGVSSLGGYGGSAGGTGSLGSATGYRGGYGGPNYTIGIGGDRYIDNAGGGGNAGFYGQGGEGGWDELYYAGPAFSDRFGASNGGGSAAGGGQGMTEGGNGGSTGSGFPVTYSSGTAGSNGISGAGGNGGGSNGGAAGMGGCGSKDFAGKSNLTGGGFVRIVWGQTYVP